MGGSFDVGSSYEDENYTGVELISFGSYELCLWQKIAVVVHINDGVNKQLSQTAQGMIHRTHKHLPLSYLGNLTKPLRTSLPELLFLLLVKNRPTISGHIRIDICMYSNIHHTELIAAV